MFRLFAAVTLLATPALAEAPDISGHWRSRAPEAMGPIFATRDFTLTDRDWTVQFRAYADAGGKLALFTLDVGGVYVLGGASASVPEAVEGIFPATHRSLTANSDAGAAFFAGQGCALTVGQPMPLVEKGCGFVPGLMQAMGEYDLVALKDGSLFFGDRSGDLTKARPTALTVYPLVRQ